MLVLLYAFLSSCFVPDTFLGIVAGATFGFERGVLLVLAGSLLAAMIQYYLSRTRLKPVIDNLLVTRPALRAI